MKRIPAKTEGYVIVSLSAKEIGKIRKMATGYGNFRKTAEKAQVPVPTLRDVLNKGYGFPDTIKQIKERLLEAETANAS